MSNEFMREEHYIVFKMSDVVEHFTTTEAIHLARLHKIQRVGRKEAGKSKLECVVVEKGWPEYEPTRKAIETRVTGAQSVPEESAIQTAARVMNIELIRERDALPSAQSVPDFADAYQGAMEEVAIWKKRALEVEDLNRKFIAEINGPMHMGEPAQPAPSVPVEAIGKMLADVMAVAVSNGANSVSMPDEYVEVAAWLQGIPAQPAPSIPEGWKLVPTAESRHPGIYKMLGALHAIDNTRGASEWESYAAMLAAAPEAKL